MLVHGGEGELHINIRSSRLEENGRVEEDDDNDDNDDDDEHEVVSEEEVQEVEFFIVCISVPKFVLLQMTCTS